MNLDPWLFTARRERPAVLAMALCSAPPLAAAGDSRGRLRLWSAGRPEPVVWQAHVRAIWSVAFSPDGGTLASAAYDGGIKLWDVPSGAERNEFRPPPDWAGVTAFATDGRILATANRQGEVMLWDAVAGERRAVFGSDAVVLSVAFSPGRDRLAVGTDNGEVRLRDLVNGTERRAFRVEGVAAALVFSAEGRLLAVAGDRTVHLWDVPSERLVRTLTGFEAPVEVLAFTAGGQALLTAGPEGAVRLWDTSTGRQLGRPDWLGSPWAVGSRS